MLHAVYHDGAPAYTRRDAMAREDLPGRGKPAHEERGESPSSGAELTLPYLFAYAAEQGASDLHLVADSRPIIRVDGSLRDAEEYPVISADTLANLITSILTPEQQRRFERTRELDFSHKTAYHRMRVNIHWEQERMGLVARVIPFHIPAMGDLGLTETEYRLTQQPHGLVLVTGPTGHGKSTTLASMINTINQERRVHMVTIEDPIEFQYADAKAVIRQRELGSDTLSFAAALKHTLRQDPNVILVGEMRDLETISAVLTLAETGHLVFSTLHTNSAAQTIDRVVDVFPPFQQQQVRLQLSLVLLAVISQRLIPALKGGRIAAREIMINNPAIANLMRQGDTAQIPSVIQTGAAYGMRTMAQSLKDLAAQGVIDPAYALERARKEETGEVL